VSYETPSLALLPGKWIEKTTSEVPLMIGGFISNKWKKS
jgi:hypothetical protein